jgi:uncharacterized protein
LPSELLLGVLALGAVGAGTMGGLGGALFLVPVLVLLGVSPLDAAPLGAMAVVAGSLAAAPNQLRAGLVHHRLGVTIECAAGTGALVGALVGTSVSSTAFGRGLAVVALIAALGTLAGRGTYTPPDPLFSFEVAGEWPGTLGGAYRLGDQVVPYEARNVAPGLLAMTGVGVVAGIGGVGGGFLKVPLMRELMRVPVKVAAATSTFTVGITAAITLLVFITQGRVELVSASAVLAGGLAGGVVGARLAHRLAPARTRAVLAVLLAVVAVVLGVQA